MEKCKFCQTELEEGVTRCPECGAENAQPEAMDNLLIEKVSSEEIIADIPEESEVETVSDAQEQPEAPAAQQDEPAAPVQEGKKVTPGKMALLVGAIVVVLALIVAMLVGGMGGNQMPAEQTEPAATGETAVPATVPADGNPDDETCKGTYTVDDEAAKAAADTVVAQIGEHTLTNAQLQVLYYMQLNEFLSSEYGSYMMYYGMLDYTQPLDTQISVMAENRTWQQFFLAEALNAWRSYCALADQAKISGMELPQDQKDFLAGIEDALATNATLYGMQSAEELVRMSIGAGVTLDDYVWYQDLLLNGSLYYDKTSENFVYTQEEVEAFFAEHEAQYAESGITKEDKYVDVRHILYMPQGGTADETGAMVYSDAEWAACEEKAAATLKEWEDGEKTEASFAELANTYSEDGGSNTNGGLYQDVYVGQMVPEFENWCFDETRQTGDTGIVRTTYGYHIMYFVSSEPMWIGYAQKDMLLEDTNAMMEELKKQYPMTVQYSDIVLSPIALG